MYHLICQIRLLINKKRFVFISIFILCLHALNSSLALPCDAAWWWYSTMENPFERSSAVSERPNEWNCLRIRFHSIATRKCIHESARARHTSQPRSKHINGRRCWLIKCKLVVRLPCRSLVYRLWLPELAPDRSPQKLRTTSVFNNH